MKAILTYTVTTDGKQTEQTRLFDTETARKICDVTNVFGRIVQEIYITKNNIIFLHNKNEDTLEVADQKKVKEWIGKNEPDKYIEFFGEVEEG